MSVIVNDSGADKLQDFLTRAENKLRKGNELTYDHCIKADALRIRNYFMESIDEYLIAISFDENNVKALQGLGLSYRHIGLIRSAVESLEKAKSIAPFDKYIRYELGCTYSQAGEYEKALKELKNAIKIDPEFMDAKFNLATTHELCGENDMALIVYSKILEERPSYIAAYHNVGSLYMRMEMNDEAINLFKQLLKINPDFTRAYLGIAIAYDKMNNAVRAIRYYKKYIALKPNSSNTPYILNRINTIRAEKKIKTHHLKLV